MATVPCRLVEYKGDNEHKQDTSFCGKCGYRFENNVIDNIDVNAYCPVITKSDPILTMERAEEIGEIEAVEDTEPAAPVVDAKQPATTGAKG